MNGKANQLYSRYHVRDRESSSGLGFDGYHGITNDVARREREHFRALANGTHKNQALQQAYNRNPRGLEFYVAFSGNKEQCEARERLLVPKKNHHWNQQRGGGPRRGISTEEAIRSMIVSAAGGSQEAKGVKAGADQHAIKDKPRSTKSKSNSQPSTEGNTKSRHGSQVVGAGAGALMLDVAAATGMAAITLGSGLGTAYALNKTIMKDSESLDDEERAARKLGRTSSTVGGAVGGLGSLGMVAVAGEVGLGTTGVSTGLAAIGSTVGGGTVAGIATTLAIPVAVAVVFCGIGYGGYKLFKSFQE